MSSFSADRYQVLRYQLPTENPFCTLMRRLLQRVLPSREALAIKA